MEKTIDNIKRFLHISGGKRNKGDVEKNLSATDSDSNQVLEEKTVITKVNLAENGDHSSNYEPINFASSWNPASLSETDNLGEVEGDACQACRQPININEVRLSNGLQWHYKCFNCYQCARDLSSQKYAYERGCLMCGPCLTTKVKTNCSRCSLIIDLEDTKLIVDGKEFHQACFTCQICSSQLDKVYGSKDNYYFCENCYVEHYGKRCASCAKVILGEGLRFGDSNFHKECFSCSGCQIVIPQPGPVRSIKGSPTCEQCYELQFTNTCSACKETVQEGLKFREQRFHVACFKCSQCALSLTDKKGEFLLTEEEGLICKKCIKENMNNEENETEDKEYMAETCDACGLPIHVKNLVLDGEKSWHNRCFCCTRCNAGLVGQKYYDKKNSEEQNTNSLFCTNCYLAEHLPTCSQCRVEIKGKNGVKMTASSGVMLTWHETCLTCCTCSQQVKMDNVVFKEDRLFCKKCYLDNMLDKCTKCHTPITGAAFSFRGQVWHDNCFECDECGAVFEDGKFRNLRDRKLCEVCFKSGTTPLNLSYEE